jgi:hypothetical protein
MFKRLSVLMILTLLGALILVTVPDVHAQRGGFGRGGFGRGGFGRGGFGGHVPSHSGSASVIVIQSGGGFFPHGFRNGPDGRFSNHFSPRLHSPFTGKFGTRTPFFFSHGFPFGFVLTQGTFGFAQSNSGLGAPIPPLVSNVPTVSPFFFGVRTEPHPVFHTVVDLSTINSIKPVSIDRSRTSNITIVNIPTNAFRPVRH